MAKSLGELGRRERQIMDVVIRRQRATAAEVLGDLPDPPSYSAVRAMLRILEEKGYVRREWDGPRHVFLPLADPERLQKDAIRHLVETFFNDSAESAMVALLGAGRKPLSAAQLDRLGRLIDEAKRKGDKR
jgi:predicted transcriptional regulator